MIYEVKFKKIYWPFWSTLKRVKGDGFVDNKEIRFFLLEDESRIEVHCKDMIFKFNEKRFYSIKKKMEIEAGQPLVTQ